MRLDLVLNPIGGIPKVRHESSPQSGCSSKALELRNPKQTTRFYHPSSFAFRSYSLDDKSTRFSHGCVESASFVDAVIQL
jgi:hypothetical protein